MNRRVAIQIQHDSQWERMLEVSADCGFDYISMGFGSSKCFHCDNWQDEIKKVRAKLDSLGLKCVMTHAPYYDLRISADFLNDAMETALLRCVKGTADLGGEIMAIHPRGYFRNDDPVPENGFYISAKEDVERSCELNIKNITPLVEEAIRCGCLIGVENLPVFKALNLTFCSNFPEAHKRILDALDPRGVCGVWDFGHSYLANEDPSAVLTSFGGRMGGTHVHDNDRTDDSHLIPLLGTINWESEMAALAGNGYSGYLTMELVYENLYNDDAELRKFVRKAYENISKLDDMLHR